MNQKLILGLTVALVILILIPSSMFAEEQTCVPSDPSISITPTNQTSSSGTTLTYTLNLKNNDNSYCNITDFRIFCDTDYPDLECNLVTSGGSETSSMIDGNIPPGYEWSRTVKVTAGFVLGPGTSYPFTITIDDGAFNRTVTKSASATGYYTVQGPILVTKEYKTVSIGEEFYVSASATSPYKWEVDTYDENYLSHIIGGVGCSSTGTCNYSFKFTALKEGETVIELKKFNTNDNYINEKKMVYVTILSETSKKIISLLDASCKDSTITLIIKNDGTVDIEVSDIMFYVNNNLITNPGCDKTIILPGETTICDSIPGSQGTNELYIPVKGYSNAISSSVYCSGGTEKTCTDSDGGKNYYVKGTVTVCTYEELGGGCGAGLDYCIGDILKEGYCEDGSSKLIEFNCPFGCEDGACLRGEGKPDLKIEKIDYSLDNPTSPMKLHFRVTIRNIGSASCSFDSNIRIPQLSNHQYNRCTYLNPGESCVETGYGYNGLGGTIPAGYYDITAVVDPRNLVDEINEYNNKLERKVYVSPPTTDFNFKVDAGKYSYSRGETVRINAVLSGASDFDFSNARVVIQLKNPNGEIINLPVERLGAVASACSVSSTTNVYTCPVWNQYSFYSYYRIPTYAPLGLYSVNAKVNLENIEKHSYDRFIVEEIYSGLVDVDIQPERMTTEVGEPVVYRVTVTDRHPIVRCSITAETETTPVTGGTIATEGVATEVVPLRCPVIYNYVINVYGLPYHSVYPTIVSLHQGSSETFELKIFPSPIRTAEGITTAVKKAEITATEVVAGERAVAITGQPIAEESSESMGQFSVAPAKPDLAYFRFTVKAYLREDSTVSDSDTAGLYVKFIQIPEPPPFPEEETINIELKRGWNLISLPGKGTGFTTGTCSVTRKPLAYIYLQDHKRYASIEEALMIMGAEKLLEYLSTHSFWIYSYEDCKVGFKVSSYSTYSGLSLVQGWNLLGTTKDMVGETLSNIKGTCSFEKIYTWNADSQKWIEKSEGDLIEEMGYGVLVKTSSACRLKTNTIQPSALPEG